MILLSVGLGGYDLMDKFGKVLSELLDVIRFPKHLLPVILLSYDEGVSHTLIRIAYQKPLVEVPIEKVALLQLQPSLSRPTPLRKIPTIHTLVAPLHSKPALLPVLELPFVSSNPLLFRAVVGLDRSLSVKEAVAPVSLHDSEDGVFGGGMGDGVKYAFAVIGI